VRITASSARSIYRQADLSQAISATLTFNYSRNSSGGTVAVQISSNGGSTWTTLQSYTLNTSQNNQSASFDILAYKATNNLVRFNVTKTGSGMFWFDNVQITYTVPSSIPATNTFLDTLGVQNVWSMGLQGDGLSVAVIDSGISKDTDFSGNTSQNLMASIIASNIPIDANGGRILRQMSFNANSNTVNDIYGHGTHVAGIIGGGGDDSGGVYAGIAPLVNLISLKVNDGTGLAYESDVVAALQWVYDNKSAYNIRVVNLSLNTTTEQSYNVSPLDAACEILWFNGIVVVASAGNRTPVSNSGYNTANAAPANDPFIITVGASDEKGTPDRADDSLGLYSSSGTTSNGFVKPDIIAPGTNIYSVLSKSSSWSTDYPARLNSTGEYFRLSGTSMAAPMVTGAIALLLQDEPNLTPDQVKYRLTHTGSTLGGYPYLDVYAVVTGTTTQSANTGLYASQLLSSGSEPIAWNSVGWNSVGWNSVGWNSVGWNSVGWNSVGWNSTFWGQ
jgi:serine protease AprX